ncbi:MAG: hypothetical protein ACOX1V_04110 [Candidatus Iainarchaeum sp.]|jgi:hypothetical protein|nr:MAG: hypothetical protein BWY55_00674 [archaeon ADurb.Bin336]
MNKGVLKKIDILVYPFHGLNSTLETPQGILKFNQWLKQIEFAGAKKDTAFIVVQDHFAEENIVRTKFERFLSRQLGDRFIVVRSGVNGMREKDLISFFQKLRNNFVLSKEVEVRRFGNYVPSASVGKVGGNITNQLRKVFEKLGVRINQREVSGLSIKKSEAYFAKMASKKLKQKLTVYEELLLLSMGLTLKERSLKPASIAHLIKRSESFGELQSNFATLTNKNKLANTLKKK